MPIESRVCPFVVDVPNYEIRDGVIFITAGEFSMAMALRTFERGHAKSARVVAAYYAQRAKVLPIGRRKSG